MQALDAAGYRLTEPRIVVAELIGARDGTFTAADAPADTWTLQTITGEAPADAAFARFVVITGDFQPGGPGGAPFFDDAFFENLGVVSTEETSMGAIKALYR